jgi:hypothetical protein
MNARSVVSANVCKPAGVTKRSDGIVPSSTATGCENGLTVGGCASGISAVRGLLNPAWARRYQARVLVRVSLSVTFIVS